MPDNLKVIPKTPEEAINKTITPYISGSVPILDNGNRANELSVTGDTLRDYHLGIKEVDEAILYHIRENLRPYVIEDNNKINVPVMYAYPEMWKSAQRDGAIRDKNGKVLFPVIAIKHDTITKNNELSNKLDGNKVHNYRLIEKLYTSKNQYDNFAVLTNRRPIKEYTVLPVPDYYTIVYSCAVYVNMMDDLNRIIEEFGYASRSYWGDRTKNIYYANIESYPVTMEMNTQDNRKIYSIFDITVNAAFVPQSVNKNVSTAAKSLSKAMIIFTTDASV